MFEAKDFYLGAQFVLWGLGKTQKELANMDRNTVRLLDLDCAGNVHVLIEHPNGLKTWNRLDRWASVFYQHQAVKVASNRSGPKVYEDLLGK